MREPPTAAALALGLPHSKQHYTREDFRKEAHWLTKVGDRIVDAHPEAEMVVGGRVITSREIDLEEAFDQAATVEEAIAVEAELAALSQPRPYDCDPIRHRRANPVIRRTRTRTRARSSLRSGRPSGSRRTSSRASSSSGDDSSGEPEPGEPRQLARLTYAVISAADRGVVA